MGKSWTEVNFRPLNQIIFNYESTILFCSIYLCLRDFTELLWLHMHACVHISEINSIAMQYHTKLLDFFKPVKFTSVYDLIEKRSQLYRSVYCIID